MGKLYLKEYLINLFTRFYTTELCITTTRNCNAFCPTCSSAGKKDGVFLSKKQGEVILKHRLFNNLDKLIISGGETMLWEDLVWFTKEARKRWPANKTQIDIFTNGLDTEKVVNAAKELKNECIRWHFPLNGFEKTHAKFKGVKGAFEKVTATMDELKKMNCTLFCAMLIMKENMHLYQELMRFVRERYKILLNIIVPVNTGIYKGNKLELPDFDDYYRFFLRYATLTTHGPYKWALEYFIWHVKYRKWMPCSGAKKRLHLLPDGSLNCCYYREDPASIIGHVTETGIEIDESARKRLRRDIRKGKCLYPGKGWICNEFMPTNTIRRNVPRLIGWKIMATLLGFLGFKKWNITVT